MRYTTGGIAHMAAVIEDDLLELNTVERKILTLS